MARPPIYDDDEHPAAARQMAAHGKTSADMAEVFGINRHTIDDWRRDHPKFAAALALGREDATDAVERALHARATGYSHKSEKIVVVDGEIRRVPTIEQYPPDTAAAKLWLTNRRHKEWADRQAVEHTGELSLRQLIEQTQSPPAPPQEPQP